MPTRVDASPAGDGFEVDRPMVDAILKEKSRGFDIVVRNAEVEWGQALIAITRHVERAWSVA